MLEPRRRTTLWASTACYRDRFTFCLMNQRLLEITWYVHTEVHQFTFPSYATVASWWIPHCSHFMIIPMWFRIFVTSAVEKRRYLPRINQLYKYVRIMPWSRTAWGCDHLARRTDLFEGLPLASHVCRNFERLCMICSLKIHIRLQFLSILSFISQFTLTAGVRKLNCRQSSAVTYPTMPLQYIFRLFWRKPESVNKWQALISLVIKNLLGQGSNPRIFIHLCSK
jgi:hypothetical protein